MELSVTLYTFKNSTIDWSSSIVRLPRGLFFCLNDQLTTLFRCMFNKVSRHQTSLFTNKNVNT